MRTAAILAVGDELLEAQADTNGPALGERLAEVGLEPRVRLILPDELDLLVRHIRAELAVHDLVLLCGGLGPTQDDLTRDAAAKAAGCNLVFSPRAWRSIQARFRILRRPLPENNRVQAAIPAGAVLLPNAKGTAPGFALALDGRILAALPGPPHECLAMYEQSLRPLLRRRFRLGGRSVHRLGLRTCGAAESALQEMLGPDFAGPGLPELGFLLDEPGEILVKLTVRGGGARQARARLQRGKRIVKKRLGNDYVGESEISLPAVVGRLLAAAGQTLAVAESCTGGLLSRRLTSVPGSSRHFLEGAVTYSNAAKTRQLGVTPRRLARCVAVCEEVAGAMARGLRTRSGADWTLSITGIAGPGGGTREKPVGTVCQGLAGPGGEVETRTLHLIGDRDLIQRRSAALALDWLRRRLLAEAGNPSGRTGRKKNQR